MCCGSHRAELSKKMQAGQAPETGAQSPDQGQPGSSTPVYFQYIGKTGITVLGRATRNLYRFDGSGATVAVDARDKWGMSFVPNLRQVDAPAGTQP